MIPLTLITGFLGSGKTTLLQQLVRRHRESRLVYLVNEFSEIDVDGQLLELPAERLVSVPGGSIFCRCLVTEFVGHLRQIAERGAEAVEGVVVEASGVANPKVVVEMLAETRLSERVRLATVVSVVDPGTFGDLLETLPNIAAQVEAADIVLVNKADLYDEDALRATEADVRRINVRAKIVRTQRCEAALDVFVPAVRGVLQGEYALCSDPNYARTRVTPADNLDLRQLATRLRPLAQRAYRLKGFVRHDGRLHLLDVSRAGITITPTTARDATPGLVCIYPPDSRDELRPLLAELESGVLASESA